MERGRRPRKFLSVVIDLSIRASREDWGSLGNTMSCCSCRWLFPPYYFPYSTWAWQCFNIIFFLLNLNS